MRVISWLFSVLIWRISHQPGASFHYELQYQVSLDWEKYLYLKRKLSSKISSLECLLSRDLMLKILGQDFLL